MYLFNKNRHTNRHTNQVIIAPILELILPKLVCGYGTSVGGQILNMFNTDSQPTLHNCQPTDDYIPTGTLGLKSANLELESADSSTDSNANPTRIGVCVRAFKVCDPSRRFPKREPILHKMIYHDFRGLQVLNCLQKDYFTNSFNGGL